MYAFDKQYGTLIITNWFLGERFVMKKFGVVYPDKLDNFEPCLIKEFKWGTLFLLGLEGLIFHSDGAQLGKLVAFLRVFHNRYNIPFTLELDEPEKSFDGLFSLVWAKTEQVGTFAGPFTTAGFTLEGNDPYHWTLR